MWFNRKKFVNIALLALITIGGIFYVGSKNAYASDTSSSYFLNGHYYNNLISDDAFIAKDSMSVEEIQRFLNEKGSYLAGYFENGRSAAQIIWDAAQGNSYDSRSNGWKPYGYPDFPDINQTTGTVSPHIILATLQKEQSLISGGYGDVNYALTHAMGYGCPDSGGCDPTKLGFTKQVDWAAWQFRYNWYRAQDYGFSDYQVGQTTAFSDWSGTYNVTPANRATASLYRYTPHVFNGNYNFWKLYKIYFESIITIRVSPGGSVNISYGGTTANCESTNCNYQIPEDTSISITAVNNPASEFANWSGCNTIDNGVCKKTMADGAIVEANFYQSLSLSPKYDSGAGNWLFSSKGKSVPYTVGSNPALAIPYNYGNLQTAIWAYVKSGSNLSPQKLFDSGPGNWSFSSMSNIVAGDFDGDGKTEIAAMYDYGLGQMKVWVFKANGDGSLTPSVKYDSGIWNWAFGRTGNLTSGDFDGDGKTEIAAMYDYGNSQARIWNFKLSGSTFVLSSKFDSGKGSWAFSSGNELSAGNIDGDSKDEIAVVYNYGNSYMKLWIFHEDGATLTSERWFDSGKGNWCPTNNNNVAFLDLDGDGSENAFTFYGYNGALTKIWEFVGTGHVYTEAR
ncbi:MAG: VCBS repeat-containing protein [Patescibacteria group bacterium]